MDNKSYVGRPRPPSMTSSNQNPEDIFRKSGGFNKMRISGASFRPSSRDGRPTSASQTMYNINMVPNLDEVSFASSIKMDLMQLQDEIDNIDLDGKLRSGSGSEFAASHISSMKKWLANNSKLSNKDVDRRVGAALDTKKLLDILKVPSPEEGMKKMYKITSLLDLLVTKFTEFEIIQLLRYDEPFSNIISNQSGNIKNTDTKLKLMASGIDTKRFLPSQANIQRLESLYQVCAQQAQDQMSKTGGFSKIGLSEQFKYDTTGINNKQDMIKYIQKLPSKVMDGDFKILLMRQLKENNDQSKLTDAFLTSQKDTTDKKGPNLEKQVAQLQAQMRELEEDKGNLFKRMQTQTNVIENLKSQLAESQQKIASLQQNLELSNQNNSAQQQQQSSSSSQPQQIQFGQKPPLHQENPEYWTKLIDETKYQYETRQMSIVEENELLKQKILEKNLKIEQLTTVVSESFQKEQDFKEWKSDYFKEFKKNFQDSKAYQNAYENALLSEFERYKKAWERKIDDLTFELEDQKRRSAQNVLDIKQKLKQEEETKQVLLRKLSCYVQC